MNGDWLNKIGIVVLGICGGLLIIPCLIPCFTRLIHSVIQGMQISAAPVDPESGREKANSLMIIKTKEDPRLIPIRQVLTRLEMKTRINTIKKEMGDCEIYSPDLCQYKTMLGPHGEM